MDSFLRHQFLFARALDEERVGLCKWTESGDSIDSALPELRSLTDDKNDWRAVIVRYEDDASMASFPWEGDNPYDFCVNRKTEGEIGESPVPLIRLTQMLGGVPEPEIAFAAKQKENPDGSRVTVYVPVEDERTEKLKEQHRELTERYRFDGKLPSEILLITLRTDPEPKEDSVWQTAKEGAASEFWKRNRYPSSCRFTVFDRKSQGPVRRDADDFRFWYTVMLFAVNEWGPASLQAYRLYSLNLVMNIPGMENAFQDMTDKLRNARYSLQSSIRKDVEGKINYDSDLPDYRLNVAVSIDLPKNQEYLVKAGSFPLTPSSTTADFSRWNSQKKRAEQEMESAVLTVDRAVDQAADKARGLLTVDPEEVTPLTRYQEEDLKRETRDLYHNIIRIQGELPESSLPDTGKVSEDVRGNLLGRVPLGSAFAGFLLVAVILLAAIVPPTAYLVYSGVGSLFSLLPVLGIYLAVAAVVALVVLAVQKSGLSSQIRQYNQVLQDAFNNLIDRSGDYSSYLSDMVSYSRGMSYLALSDQMKWNTLSTHDSKYRDIRTIAILLNNLSIWCRAFDLDVDFSAPRAETAPPAASGEDSLRSRKYLFDTGEEYKVPVNRSGQTMESPYPFAERLEILPEELYDD